jgi:zinc transporter 9
MAESPLTLLVLSAIMALSSFLAGIVPLSLSLSQQQLRIITALGSGILVGTALIIIIPEGIETLYSDEHTHTSKRSDDHDHEESRHGYVGLALVFGFVLMYLIDVFPPLMASSTHSGSIPLSSSETDDELISPHKESHSHSHVHATTIGLVVHSFADGIALGASSTMPSVGLIVFGAIMLHKAPAAFGLTAALLKQGLNKRAARTHLLLFSLAAPLGAFVTWALVSSLAGKDAQQGSTFWTGIAMVFSGGTFL